MQQLYSIISIDNNQAGASHSIKILGAVADLYRVSKG